MSKRRCIAMEGVGAGTTTTPSSSWHVCVLACTKDMKDINLRLECHNSACADQNWYAPLPTISDDKRPKRAPLPVPPHQRSKKRKIDVIPEEHTLSEILPTTQPASHDQVCWATSSEPTNLEHDIPVIRVVGHTKSQSVDSTLPSQSEYSLPTLTSHTESSHQTPNPTCKYNYVLSTN